MKPTLRKAAGGGWWCDNSDIVGFGSTPALAYEQWKFWMKLLDRDLLDISG